MTAHIESRRTLTCKIHTVKVKIMERQTDRLTDSQADRTSESCGERERERERDRSYIVY